MAWVWFIERHGKALASRALIMVSHILIVSKAANLDLDEVVQSVRVARDAFLDEGCQVLGIVVNRTEPDKVTKLKTALEAEFYSNDVVLSVIPTNTILSSPTIKEIADELKAEILYGQDQLDKLAYRYLIIAMRPIALSKS